MSLRLCSLFNHYPFTNSQKTQLIVKMAPKSKKILAKSCNHWSKLYAKSSKKFKIKIGHILNNIYFLTHDQWSWIGQNIKLRHRTNNCYIRFRASHPQMACHFNTTWSLFAWPWNVTALQKHKVITKKKTVQRNVNNKKEKQITSNNQVFDNNSLWNSTTTFKINCNVMAKISCAKRCYHFLARRVRYKKEIGRFWSEIEYLMVSSLSSKF